MFTDTRAVPAKGRFFPLSRNALADRIARFPHYRCGGYHTERLRLHLRNSSRQCAYGHQLCTFVPFHYVASLSLPACVPSPLARRALDCALEHVAVFGDPDALPRRPDRTVVFVRAFLGPLALLTITRHAIRHRGNGLGPGYWGSLITLPRRLCDCRDHEVLLRTTIRCRRFWQ